MIDRWRYFKYRILAYLALQLFQRSPQSTSDPDPFFVFGSGRNGSTLLATLLNNHSEIFIPPEQHVLPYSLMSWYLNVFKSKNYKVVDFIERLCSKRHTTNWQLNSHKLDGLHQTSVEYSFYQMVDAVYRTYGIQVKRSKNFIWGDKSPLNTHFLPLLWGDFSKAKYIFLVRDPRDVVLSYSKISIHPAREIDYAIWKWKDSYRQYKYLQKKGAKLKLIRYDDLVINPKETIKDVLVFLNKNYSENILRTSKNAEHMGVSEAAHHQNLKNEINAQSIGRWRKDLAIESVRLVEKKCHTEMKELNYDIQ